MDRVIEQIPRFFSPLNLEFLAQAMGLTLALTFFGCVLGFLLAFIVVYMRMTPGWLGLPWRILAILYVEIFRRIPFLVITYLVLFFIAAFVKGASLFAIAADRHLRSIRPPIPPRSSAAASSRCRASRSRRRPP